MHADASRARTGGDALRQSPNAVVGALGGTQQPTALSASTTAAVTSIGLVDDDGAAAFFGCSKRTFSTFMSESWMPLPINLGPRLRRWSLDELRAAVADMPRQTQRSQPESLLRARIERMKATGAAS